MAHVLSGAFVLTSNCKIIGHSFFNRKRVINPKLTRSTLSQLRQIRISGKESIWESIWESSAVSPSAVSLSAVSLSAVSPSAVSPSGRCDAMVVSVALARTNDHERPVPRRPVPGLETGRSIWLRDQGCLSAVSSGPRLLVRSQQRSEVACRGCLSAVSSGPDGGRSGGVARRGTEAGSGHRAARAGDASSRYAVGAGRLTRCARGSGSGNKGRGQPRTLCRRSLPPSFHGARLHV